MNLTLGIKAVINIALGESALAKMKLRMLSYKNSTGLAGCTPLVLLIVDESENGATEGREAAAARRREIFVL